MTEKYTVDGKVAVIVSPGFGAGWSTWCSSENRENAMYDPILVKAILDGKNEKELVDIASERYPKEYHGGIEDNIYIEWLPEGTPFYIHEYDGSESVRTGADLVYSA
jgi:hypothetical protein